MSDQPGKPCEWLINTLAAEDTIISLNNFGNNIGEFHVIEYKAYQAVVAENERLHKDSVETLKKLRICSEERDKLAEENKVLALAVKKCGRLEYNLSVAFANKIAAKTAANKLLVEALEDISAYFGTDYADGHAVTAHDALERHAKIMEGVES